MALTFMAPFEFDAWPNSYVGQPLPSVHRDVFRANLYGAAWSDNLFSFGTGAEAAANNISEWAKALHILGSMTITYSN